MNDNNEQDFEREINESEDYSDEVYAYQLKIPLERVAILIGKEGKVKKLIEKETNAILDISKEGDVNVQGDDGLSLFSCKEIVRAIGRGFNPSVALELIKTDYVLEIINLRDIVGKSHKSMERLKGRIIGEKGKSRRVIEEMTGCYISVYGKTIGIIGEVNNAYLAHQAVNMLLQGSMHKTVYKFLERKQQEAQFGKEYLV